MLLPSTTLFYQPHLLNVDEFPLHLSDQTKYFLFSHIRTSHYHTYFVATGIAYTSLLMYPHMNRYSYLSMMARILFLCHLLQVVRIFHIPALVKKYRDLVHRDISLLTLLFSSVRESNWQLKKRKKTNLFHVQIGYQWMANSKYNY